MHVLISATVGGGWRRPGGYKQRCHVALGPSRGPSRGAVVTHSPGLVKQPINKSRGPGPVCSSWPVLMTAGSDWVERRGGGGGGGGGSLRVDTRVIKKGGRFSNLLSRVTSGQVGQRPTWTEFSFYKHEFWKSLYHQFINRNVKKRSNFLSGLIPCICLLRSK